MEKVWTTILAFPLFSAGMMMPREAATERSPETANSRATTMMARIAGSSP